MKAFLYLEDGSVMEGKSFGAVKETVSEIVFNTGMTGYQEILTDPSYKGQSVVMTYPIIGNYGINKFDDESSKVQVESLIVREFCDYPSHFKSCMGINDYLVENDVPGICGLDTRMLTKKIRQNGVMRCLLAYEEGIDHISKIRNYKFPTDAAKSAGVKRKLVVSSGEVNIGIVDLGCKNGIVRQLVQNDCRVTMLPADVSADEIICEKFDGLVVSNGPGDPKDNMETVEVLKKVLGRLPIRGICLGNQLLALALGADTYKMKFGHRGGNHPVVNLKTGKVIISSQNHGYAVNEKTLPPGVVKTYENINDNTFEGFEYTKYNIKAVQFHPEEGPGPVDGHEIIREWINEIKEDENYAQK
ncbi:carbamoyl phosphate synthase small subunit [Alkalibacter mobilis]|uniref:carbamoyl phosphate synthase small subunit n=1 Tax=Alkalibacter mobilis TaxID=2787712 RepID=UPI00189F7C4C|nr:carbamoyl phosphate synthase small subunit [Alkalibacter mobilis]MBF7096521.1 glutamine-hydrolyzing carbamoyl-phosphate synthase small subunit [Alkalibacter mobilis]